MWWWWRCFVFLSPLSLLSVCLSVCPPTYFLLFKVSGLCLCVCACVCVSVPGDPGPGEFPHAPTATNGSQRLLTAANSNPWPPTPPNGNQQPPTVAVFAPAPPGHEVSARRDEARGEQREKAAGKYWGKKNQKKKKRGEINQKETNQIKEDKKKK